MKTLKSTICLLMILIGIFLVVVNAWGGVQDMLLIYGLFLIVAPALFSRGVRFSSFGVGIVALLGIPVKLYTTKRAFMWMGGQENFQSFDPYTIFNIYAYPVVVRDVIICCILLSVAFLFLLNKTESRPH